MNTKLILKNILYISTIVLITGLVVFTVTNAGSLSPTLSPASTFYTLADIYTRLTTNATATEANHDLSTSASPSATFYTLKQIYDAIPTIDATKVLTGTSYLGVAGTAVSGVSLDNMFNGTSGIYTGGSQASGGIDDYNNNGSAPIDRYACATGWTICNSGNDYCGTGDIAADTKDNCAGLIWSLRCGGSACSSFSNSSTTEYSWDSSNANNGGRTSSQLCSDHSGWYLPHQKQMMQAYINGAHGNLGAVAYALYWSATTRSISSSEYAYRVDFSTGRVGHYSKTVGSSAYVRCVRTAP